MHLKKYLLLIALFIFTANTNTIAEASSNTAPALSAKQESIVTVSALTAQGDLARLKIALNTALDNKLTINELKEVLIQMYAYTGFPKSLNGLNSLMTVVQERQAKGIHDELGRDASEVDPDRNRYEIGEKNQTKLVGRPIQGKVYDFAPTIGVFLKEHLFGDIFERDVLDWQSRELATVGALAGLYNVNPQLASHMKGSMNVGISERQLKEVIVVLTKNVDEKIGKNADTVLKEVLSK